MLLPYQLYNYKIEIKPDKENVFGYTPLCKQFIAKL